MKTNNNLTIFHILLGNSLVGSVTNFFVWFALVFWVFLQTQSLIASSLIGGFFAVANMITALQFGNIVDHNRKHSVILRSSIGSVIAYSMGAIVYFSSDPSVFTTIGSCQLWVLVVVLMSGTIIGNLRNIALSTTVSLLLPVEEHAKANGKIGTINGVGFTLTSVASGLVIGFLGMGWAIAGAAIMMLLVIGHLLTFDIPEKKTNNQNVIARTEDEAINNNQQFINEMDRHAIARDDKDVEITRSSEGQEIHHTQSEQPLSKKLNIRETIATINEIPGLFALIFFTTFNNFLGGVFMALMDPYGLLLVSVQTWGMIFAVTSLAFIGAGIYISKKGLGKNPLKTMFYVNIAMWITCIYFVVQPSIWLLISGMVIWMFASPFAEASEATVLQKVVPYEKQGRVFGIAQSIESAAMPITALLIGPIAELFFIPLMSEGGRGANLIGSWFGTGIGRGIAVVFIIAGIIGLIVTLIAYRSRYYKLLVNSYMNSNNETSAPHPGHPAEVGIN